MVEPTDEKDTDPTTPIKADNVHTGVAPSYEQDQGYVQEYAAPKAGIELRPRPTSDRFDPLNFSRSQKLICLAVVMYFYFWFTAITTITVPSFLQLQEQYGISYAQVNWTVAIPALGLTVGPLIWSSLADIFGRRLIFIVGTVIAFFSTIGAALAPDYSSYMAARFFQGLGVSPASTVGLAIINDLFFEHERGQKVGLWVLALDMGLLVGPLIGGFITLVNQFWVQWLTAIIFGVLLVAEVFFLPETLYPRSLMLSRLPTTTDGSEKAPDPQHDDYPARTRALPFINLKPVPGVGAQKPYDALFYFFKTWSYPNVVISVFFYSFAFYWWILSVVTYLPVAYIQYQPQIQGLLFLGLILGTLFSEVLCSGTLSDFIVTKLAKKNNDVRVAEMRLWLMYPSILLATIGLIAWGISVDKGYHWFVGQVALFLVGAGIQMGNTAVSTYVVDCYPHHAMSMITFYAVLLNGSAFVNPFFIAPWCDTVGFSWTFAVQGLITLLVMVPVTMLLQVFGERMRTWRGPPSWVSPEYSI